MLRHIGIDLVAVQQIEQSLGQHGDRFLERVYTPRERRDSGGSAAQLAARFAAKEATMKALRRHDEGFGWSSIEVVTGDDGRAELRLTGGAARLAAERGVEGLSLSMTRQRRHAAAVVIAEAASHSSGRGRGR